MKKRRSPQITQKAKNIERDPTLFGERLYPFHKIIKFEKPISAALKKTRNKQESFNVSNVDSFFQENENIKALYGDCSLINVYRKESKNNFDDFDFQPVLCDNSLKIADRLEPAINRLTKAKKKRNKNSR